MNSYQIFNNLLRDNTLNVIKKGYLLFRYLSTKLNNRAISRSNSHLNTEVVTPLHSERKMREMFQIREEGKKKWKMF